ncbi:MAG: hypothetical protein ABEH78_07445 [Haloferacaceae archaeon]
MDATAFDTDWATDDLDVDEATDRMFALGVAAVLDCAPDHDVDDSEAVRNALVGEEGSARSAADAVRDSDLPDALAPAELLDRFEDETSLLDPPGALRRD